MLLKIFTTEYFQATFIALIGSSLSPTIWWNLKHQFLPGGWTIPFVLVTLIALIVARKNQAAIKLVFFFILKTWQVYIMIEFLLFFIPILLFGFV